VRDGDLPFRALVVAGAGVGRGGVGRPERPAAEQATARRTNRGCSAPAGWRYLEGRFNARRSTNTPASPTRGAPREQLVGATGAGEDGRHEVAEGDRRATKGTAYPFGAPQTLRPKPSMCRGTHRLTRRARTARSKGRSIGDVGSGRIGGRKSGGSRADRATRSDRKLMRRHCRSPRWLSWARCRRARVASRGTA